MAVQVSYTDEMGVTHSEAYAKISAIKIKFHLDVATFYVDIWHNEAARSKSDPAAEKQIITSIAYTMIETLFDTHLKDSIVKANDVSVLSSLYTWLKQHNDGANKRDSQNRYIDNQGNSINWTTATSV